MRGAVPAPKIWDPGGGQDTGQLTYFQPRVVLQLSQKMSATEWSPVSSSRCSAGPQPTLTLRKTRSRGHAGGVPPIPCALQDKAEPRGDSLAPGMPPGTLRAPRYSHGVEEVGTAMAALEGLRGHGTSHRGATPGPTTPPGGTATGGGTPMEGVR